MPDGQTVAATDGRQIAPVHDNARIGDEGFLRQLDFLRALREFALQEAIKAPLDDNVLEFNNLNTLRKGGRGGRDATVEEWNLVEDKTRKLLSLLDEGQRKRFRLSRSTNFLLFIPVALMVLALVALVTSVTLSIVPPPPLLTPSPTVEHLIAFMVWLMSLGGMGAVAFIYVNALSIQIDPNVDVINRGFVAMRTILGALFAIVLTLPYGYHAYLVFCLQVKLGATPDDINQPILLLMPFVLGFSTPLVLAVLNRVIDSVQIFFGLKPAAPVPPGDDRPKLAER